MGFGALLRSGLSLRTLREQIMQLAQKRAAPPVCP
jgi:hypothetical protein